jgi:hypothetical protein
MTSITLPVSIGEALDKLSILDIKLRRISDGRRLDVQCEYDILYTELASYIEAHAFYYKKMIEVNEIIWDDQDFLRGPQQTSFSDAEYAAVCRKILDNNDMRFRIKNKINTRVNSSIREQKGYAQKKALLVSHMGLGDVINIMGAIRYFSLIYDELYIVVKDEYKTNIAALIGSDQTVKYLPSTLVHANPDVQLTHNSLVHLANSLGCDLLAAGQYAADSPKRMTLPFSFYDDLKVPTAYYKSYFHVPEYTEQAEYLALILAETPRIVFTHLNASNRCVKYNEPLREDVFYCDPCTSHYKPGDRFYELSQKLLNLPIIAYTKIIEAAEELYLIDSVFMCLAGLLNTEKAAGRKRVYIPTENPTNTPVVGRHAWDGFLIHYIPFEKLAQAA